MLRTRLSSFSLEKIMSVAIVFLVFLWTQVSAVAKFKSLPVFSKTNSKGSQSENESDREGHCYSC